METKEKKLQVLAEIAEGLNAAGVLWCVGASLLLYFHGIVDDFHDIDILVAAPDADAAEHVLNALGERQPPHPAPQYATKRFLEYVIDGVEADMMAGFSVIADGVRYDCDLRPEQIEKYITVGGQRIPLQYPGCWKRYYRLMGRANKVALLQQIGER